MRKIAATALCLCFASSAAWAGWQKQNTADVDAIRQANQKYIRATASGNVDVLMTFYANDAILMPPNESTVEGIDAVQVWWRSYFHDFVVLEGTSELHEVVVFGDWAYGRGRFTSTAESRKGGELVADDGRFSGLWRRQPDGTWKIARDMWNSDRSPVAK